MTGHILPGVISTGLLIVGYKIGVIFPDTEHVVCEIHQ